MGDIVIYAIIGLGIYTVVIVAGYKRAVRIHRRKNMYRDTLHSFVTELKQMLIKEENDRMENKLSLSTLVTSKPTEANYEEIMELLAELARDTFEEYKFFIARSQDETKQANFVQIVSNYHENPYLHTEIFRRGIDYGIDMKTLQAKFAEKIARGEVIDLGNAVRVITDDNTGQPPTGVSPINSGLEGGEISFIISFVKRENFDKWVENTFPKEEE